MPRKRRSTSRSKETTIPISTRLREEQVEWMHAKTLRRRISDSEFIRECVDAVMAMDRRVNPRNDSDVQTETSEAHLQ